MAGEKLVKVKEDQQITIEGETYTVKHACKDANEGHWYCVKHKQGFANQLEKDLHIGDDREHRMA